MFSIKFAVPCECSFIWMWYVKQEAAGSMIWICFSFSHCVVVDFKGLVSFWIMFNVHCILLTKIYKMVIDYNISTYMVHRMHGCLASPKLIIICWIFRNLPSNHGENLTQFHRKWKSFYWIKVKPMYSRFAVCTWQKMHMLQN